MTQQSHSWAYTRENPEFQKDTGTSVFTAALFTIAQTWKQPNVHQQEWLLMWHTSRMEYHSARKWDEIVPYAETWIDLETVIQSEVKSEKNKYAITRICGI